MSYRTANLQMLHFVYYSTNIRTEYFKHAAHSPFFSLQNAVYFIHNATFFGSCVIHILYTGCAKINKKNSGAKRLITVSLLREIKHNAELRFFSGSTAKIIQTIASEVAQY